MLCTVSLQAAIDLEPQQDNQENNNVVNENEETIQYYENKIIDPNTSAQELISAKQALIVCYWFNPNKLQHINRIHALCLEIMAHDDISHGYAPYIMGEIFYNVHGIEQSLAIARDYYRMYIDEDDNDPDCVNKAQERIDDINLAVGLDEAGLDENEVPAD